MSRLIRFNKPYGVLPQFTDPGNTGSPRATLGNYIDLAKVYPAGRLDQDSEGLMLLTDDGKQQARISDPRHKMAKTYLVQVEVARRYHVKGRANAASQGGYYRHAGRSVAP